MGNVLEPTLINILIILLPICLYQLIWHESILLSKHDIYNSMTFGLVCSVSLILCMTFAVEPIPEYRFDMRLIPIFIGILYGGYLPGAMVVTAFYLYRLILGGDGVFFSVVVFILPFLIAFLMHKKFIMMSNNRKIISISTLLIVTHGWSLLLTNVLIKDTGTLDWFSFNIFMLGFMLLNFSTMLLAVLLIHNTYRNNRIFMEAQKSEQLQTIGQLAASVAHEIRNPMTVVRGFLQIFQNSTNMTEDQQKFTQIMINEMDRAQVIITDYLSLAKPTSELFLEKINLQEHLVLIKEVMSPFALYKGISIEEFLDPDLFVFADKEKLSQVLVNILKNSIEASSDGASILLKAEKINNFIHIKVIDFGEGMTEEQVKQLGTPFYSTKEKGTGIGMMVSYNIIHYLQGKIEVKSKKGYGTTMTIILPEAK